jgi:hypothetical protein
MAKYTVKRRYIRTIKKNKWLKEGKLIKFFNKIVALSRWIYDYW